MTTAFFWALTLYYRTSGRFGELRRLSFSEALKLLEGFKTSRRLYNFSRAKKTFSNPLG
jgi:hypothetical protein